MKAKGHLFCQNSIRKGRGLHHGAEPPHIELCEVPTYRRPGVDAAMEHVKCGITAFRTEAYLRAKNVQTPQRRRRAKLLPVTDFVNYTTWCLCRSMREQLYPISQRTNIGIPLKDQYFISYFIVLCNCASCSTIANTILFYLALRYRIILFSIWPFN